MYKKVNELISMLEESGQCEVKLINREKHIYSIVSLTGLAWRNRSKKFGSIQAGEKRLRLDFDYPTNLFTTSELKEAVNLPLKEEAAHQRSSHVHLIVNSEGYDTLRIIIYRKELEDFNFEDDKFKAMIDKILAAKSS